MHEVPAGTTSPQGDRPVFGRLTLHIKINEERIPTSCTTGNSCNSNVSSEAGQNQNRRKET